MKFTQDWFSHNIPALTDLLKNEKIESILEIGCFEGRSTCWFLQNVLPDDGYIDSVDTFAGSEEHEGMDFGSVEKRWHENTKEVAKKGQEVNLNKITSTEFMGVLLSNNSLYDLIYIDGSHACADVLTDACMGYHLLRVGGTMIFDDYLWKMEWPATNRPKAAVDFFLEVFHGKVAVTMFGYQVAVKRIK